MLPAPPPQVAPVAMAASSRADDGDEDAEMRDPQSENESIIEEVSLSDVDIEAERRRQQADPGHTAHRSAHDEDDEDSQPRGPGGCRAQ